MVTSLAHDAVWRAKSRALHAQGRGTLRACALQCEQRIVLDHASSCQEQASRKGPDPPRGVRRYDGCDGSDDEEDTHGSGRTAHAPTTPSGLDRGNCIGRLEAKEGYASSRANGATGFRALCVVSQCGAECIAGIGSEMYVLTATS